MRSACFALLLFAATADAAPIAQLAKDVDGDGADDKVELDANGELRIQTKAGTSKQSLAATVTRATLSTAVVKGTPTIVVQATTPSGDQGVVYQYVASGWKVVVRTPVGGVGLDGDYGIALDATSEGLYRYQTRAGYRRCDGKPAYLFGERFEAGQFQRMSFVPVNVPNNAPVIAARIDTAGATSSRVYKARFASHQPGTADAGALGIPAELDDGKPTTVWREELVKSAGEGQFFTYEPRFNTAKATQIRIVPGNPTSAASFKGSNRPQRIAVVSAQGTWHIDLPDAQREPLGTAYVADLPAPVQGCVTIILESTYGPDKGTTAIAELQVFGEGERTGGGEAALARVIAEGKEGSQLAAQELARSGAAGAAAIDAELGKTTDAGVRSRLVRAAMEIRDPAAGPILVRAATQGWVHGKQLVEAIAALAGLGQAQELHDLAANSKLAIDARVAAVHALRPAIEKDRDLLIQLAGRGLRELRQATIEQLTVIDVATLAKAAPVARKATAAGDLWRATTRRAHAKPDERAPALAAMSAALPTVTDYERRYRLIDGIAAIGDAPALASLAALLKQLPDTAETAAFKQVAARAIAVNPRAEALDLLIAFTGDRDPGVRLAALSAIAGVGGGAAGVWHGPSGPDGVDRVIITVLSTDTWPEVRRYAAQVLGGRCSRPGPAAALAHSIAKDKNVGVRGDALAGLVECKATGTAELLAKLWDDSKAPLELRQRAVDLSVELGDPTIAKKLVSKFTQWRGAALESAAALALAQNAAAAIGRLRPPGAADALIAALDDSAFPEIVAAGAAGLGLLGPQCPVSAKPKLKLLASSDEQQVQIAASRAAPLCGKP